MFSPPGFPPPRFPVSPKRSLPAPKSFARIVILSKVSCSGYALPGLRRVGTCSLPCSLLCSLPRSLPRSLPCSLLRDLESFNTAFSRVRGSSSRDLELRIALRLQILRFCDCRFCDSAIPNYMIPQFQMQRIRGQIFRDRAIPESCLRCGIPRFCYSE